MKYVLITKIKNRIEKLLVCEIVKIDKNSITAKNNVKKTLYTKITHLKKKI